MTKLLIIMYINVVTHKGTRSREVTSSNVGCMYVTSDTEVYIVYCILQYIHSVL